MYVCLQDEKYNAAAYCQQLEGERGRAKTTVLEQDSTPESVSIWYIAYTGPCPIIAWLLVVMCCCSMSSTKVLFCCSMSSMRNCRLKSVMLKKKKSLMRQIQVKRRRSCLGRCLSSVNVNIHRHDAVARDFTMSGLLQAVWCIWEHKLRHGEGRGCI